MKKSNVFIGRELYSCGACSVESILSYYGGYVPHETVLIDTNTTKFGTNAYDIIKALNRYGFNAYGLRISLESIKSEYLPLIAHTTIEKYDHFLVIYEITKKKVITMDPKWGIKSYSYDYFKKIFNEVVIIAKPIKKIVCMEKKKTLKKVFIKCIVENRRKILLLLNTSIIIIILGFIISAFVKIVNTKYIYQFLFIFIFLIILKWLLNYINTISQEKIANKFKREFIYRIVNHIFHLERMYIANKRVGEIICKINDSSYIVDFFTKFVFSGSINIIALMMGLFVLFLISYKMSVVISCASLIYLLITYVSSKKLYRKEMENIDSYNNYSGDLAEYLEGIESIKNLGVEKNYVCKLANSFEKYTKTSFISFKYNSLISCIKNLILEIGYIISLAIYLFNISNNNEIFNIIIFTSIYSIYADSLMNITSYIPGFIHIKAIYQNISEFLDLKHEGNSERSLNDFSEIIIKNMTYSYNHLNDVFSVDKIVIKKGDKILLTGSSGMGKSTLVKCLSGYLKDYGGTITIDKVDIKDISILDIKKNILYVGQDENLFTDTIKNNIVLDKYDDIRFENTIDICELSEVINKKNDKENSLILDHGINYSKGEKSRLILARSLYKSPKILIIDELLSSVPEEQENRILKRLLSIKDLTLIYITHRNKQEYFDKVITLERKEKDEII